ncbi:MAG TPA: Gfo/Idh/MocA family oxidoreductase [Planctomicrobium sp.]|nr:Gfo/Idh/MocA family oxidoreductase [Planctomicrobium sp.]
MSSPVNRRSFLQTSSVAAGAMTLLSTAPARAQDANQRLRIGFIGPGGRGFGAHVRTLAALKNEGRKIDLVALADVYSVQRDKVADYIKKENGNDPAKYVDYREMIEKENLDAVAIATPDHWHRKQIVDSLNAGLHVYCEKPMTKTVEEAIDVANVWKKSGKVMQVGVQGTSNPCWNQARAMIDEGKLGKVLMFQTEYFRNSNIGQWRYYQLAKEMTPQTIDWKRWLGVEERLAEDRPFDREVYIQWRRFWPYGSGMFTDLFVHRVTAMLKATGLRFPGRVTGAGGIYLEYDGRDVPDVATVVADYPEGVQGLVSSTMCSQETRLQQCIRGHFGSFTFEGGKIQFVPERPQVTKDSKIVAETFDVEKTKGDDHAHFSNWIDAIEAGKPELVNNDPELGAAAVATVILGAQSYRNGIVYYYNKERGPYNAFEAHKSGESWAKQWEDLSEARGKPHHVPGWKAGDYGSTLEDPAYMSLAGPWINGNPPEKK